MAERLGYKTEMNCAKWDEYGARAGPIRNSLMLDTNPVLVIAFVFDKDNLTPGTADTVRKARKRNIDVLLITPNYVGTATM